MSETDLNGFTGYIFVSLETWWLQVVVNESKTNIVMSIYLSYKTIISF